MSKYNARQIKIKEYLFDSEQESKRYKELSEKENSGDIYNLQVHPVYILQDEFEKNGIKWKKIVYEADFSYITKDGKNIVEDVKGFITPEFEIKRILFENKYPDLTIDIVRHYQGRFMGEKEYKLLRKEKRKEYREEYKELKQKIEEWNNTHPNSVKIEIPEKSTSNKKMIHNNMIMRKTLEKSIKEENKYLKLKNKMKRTAKEEETFINLKKKYE